MKILLALIFVSNLSVASEVFVKPEVETQGADIVLGDIAPGVGEELHGLILDAAPARGKTAVWSASEVGKRLRAYQGVLKNVQFKIPQKVRITKQDAGIKESLIKAKILSMLQTLVPHNAWEVKLISLEKIHWPELSETAQWNVVPLTKRPRGAAQFEITIQDQGKVIQHLWVNGQVSFSAMVPVAQKVIPAREKIQLEDIAWERRDVTYLVEVPSTERDFSAAVTKLSLSPGTLITRNYLERELAVKFGQEVEVQAGGNDFSVSTKAVSQQNAYVGDIVRLKVLNGSKIISGTVIAKGKAEINY